MKLPRDLDARRPVYAVKAEPGYEITRQLGSHIRSTTFKNGKHGVTVPAHNPVNDIILSVFRDPPPVRFRLR